MTEIQTGSELDEAAEEFFRAAYKYRSALKRLAPQADGGVIWVRRGTESISYSHMERYTQQLAEMTFDRFRDSLVFTEPRDPDNEEYSEA